MDKWMDGWMGGWRLVLVCVACLPACRSRIGGTIIVGPTASIQKYRSTQQICRAADCLGYGSATRHRLSVTDQDHGRSINHSDCCNHLILCRRYLLHSYIPVLDRDNIW
ncbi:hypothetical protein GGS21DRAFT_532132 [Xylaria nigripes]|nr:hypothetical protein GGS21DRAFT_532132 [Xylaria nigripes]